ncbi:MAG: prepilin-type N-terminal cleavage/methylation domain-containing protein [Gammaproteobacteria bacterium]|nr:MAG: prepilin-type N-terminal cleavage/methylation domain-containing protein [Gammaproteobacteria bacterium]
MQMKHTHRGFTLVELMIVVLIASILLGVGLPSYRNYVMRAGRADAKIALLKIAGSQEKFYLQNGAYASAAQLVVAPPAGLGFLGGMTEHEYYTLTLAPHAAGLAVGYTATAAHGGSGKQGTDTTCTSFSIDQNSRRGANGGYVPATVEKCWR